MLQPRSTLLLLLIIVLVATDTTGYENLASSRVRRQDDNDVTTVLLVDNHGRSSLGRFLNVKPAVGLLTSTARTFIQEGVTTEYATQVLGTTLDNGRLYAHLLTKSSRVLYNDNDLLNTRSHLDSNSNNNNNKQWNFDNNNVINKQNINFAKNTDFISSTKSDAFLVFPTTKPSSYRFVEKKILYEKLQLDAPVQTVNEASEEEILNQAQSTNQRIPYQEPHFRQKQSSFSTSSSSSSSPNNVKVFKINPAERHINLENYSNFKEQSTENDVSSNNRQEKEQKYVVGIQPSKIKPRLNIPTFTVRNDFSPSGFSLLGDLPEFDYDISTERNRPTTPAERKAKLLFRGGQPVRQELKYLETVTYMGFADFTTTVGDTVIIFSPHTTSSAMNYGGQITSISGAATIKPTFTNQDPTVTSTIKTFFSHDPARKTETVTGHKLNMQTSLPTMVIDASNRNREPKEDESLEEQQENLDAKLAVLAHEQDTNKYESTTTDDLEPSIAEEDQLETVFTSDITSSQPELTTVFTPDLIQPSETSQTTVMLSTPSDEDIAKIFASLANLARNTAQTTQATEPLTAATTEVIVEAPTVTTESETETRVLGGATTIFFEDDFGLFPTHTFESVSNTKVTTNPPTTLQEEVSTENPPTTIEQQQKTTQNLPLSTEKVIDTTERPSTEQIPRTEEPTTLNEIFSTSEEAISTLSLDETTPELINNEVDSPKPFANYNDIDIQCNDGGRVVPTTVYKTLTYLTTFFIPVETTTTTSVKSNVVVSTEIGFQTEACQEAITSTSVQENTTPLSTSTPEQTATEHLTTITEQTTPQETTELTSTTEQVTTIDFSVGTTPMETTPMEITTEQHVTELESEPLETTTDSGEEIELIFKTLYTTYTYLTTFFQETTSTVSSRKVVITNVITSTLDPGSQASDPAVAGLFAREDSVVQHTDYTSKPASFEDFVDINPSQTNLVQPTIGVTTDNDLQDNVYDSKAATPGLSDENIIQATSAIKTYYTTYTYFTTIFVDGETEVSSRTEVYTNFITPSGAQSEATNVIVSTAANELSKDQVESPETDSSESGRDLKLKVTPLNNYNSTILRQKPTTIKEDSTDIYEIENDNLDNNILATKTDLEPSHSYTTLHRSKSIDNEPTHNLENSFFNINDYDAISTMVTDVRSSSSTGDRRILDNLDKRNVLDDQIVAESNNDSEISPSPTLLLQTSFTTFTYFTTMYYGTTSSNVVSRLDTITNVVTETLRPTLAQSIEDQSQPITYFTTFTYWTTLYKDGSTTITSREDTVSNVVTPTVSPSEVTSAISITQTIEPTEINEDIRPSSTIATDDEFTTFYTTYTYFTTSYLGNTTILNSRLETVTNVVNNTAQPDPQTARAIGSASQNIVSDDEKLKTVTPALPTLYPTGLLSTMVSSEVQNGTTTQFSTDIYGTYIDGLYAKVLESTTNIVSETIAPSSVTPVLPTGILSLNQGKIVDAEGVSTLFYTTHAIGTYIDNLYAQVIESTSSLSVNEERKSALFTSLDPVALAHRTGLVRLIEGSIIQNKTTTVYQSKVLGTVIDGRYAQIIESTSSYIVEKPAATIPGRISATATLAPNQQIAATATPITPSPVVIESSLNEDSTKRDEDNTTEDEDDEEEDDEEDDNNSGNSRVKSRLTFSTKKRTFTPAIRPFASRNRPTFNPKRKGASANGPTTITRSDFTPTITATPALKSDSTRGRFNGNRRTSANAAVVSATPSGSRRFSRPRSTTSAAGGSSVAFTPGGRRSSSGRIQATVSGSKRGGGGFRTSSAAGGRASSNIFTSNSRFRIRPTVSSTLLRGQSTLTTPSPDSNDGENDLTTLVTDEPTDFTEGDSDTTLPLSTTTESGLRRSSNPLLRFRRPPLPRPQAGPTTPRAPTTPKRNGNLRKATTTTSKPKTKTNFNRPNQALSNRPRAGGNGLFPRRDLFRPRTPPPEEPKEDEDGEDILTGDDLDFEDDDTEYEGSDTQTEKTLAPQKRNSRGYSPVQIKPFGNIRRRVKRQSPYSRFRRPGAAGTKTTTTTTPEPTEAPKTSRSKVGRFRPRGGTTTTQATTNAPKRITPSRANNNQGRAQFTLREKDNATPRSNFKRPGSQTNGRRTTSKPATASRPKAPRLRTTTSKISIDSRNSNNRPKSSSNRRGSRGRTTQRTNENYSQRGYDSQQIDNNFVVPAFDGTITITHQVPTEATIPVINGKITEYKNIVTAKLSTEVLGPQQYTTRINSDGKEVKVLTSESTNIAGNGATEVTQFFLNEMSTTSVVFTPTYIRGRRTSFSHVIPSTVYGVDLVVSTIQPQLSAQAPLANILLSQLLLGNLGIPNQNPLLQLQNQGNAPPPTPTTEFKTRTTTYVTTVTDATSTVIPLTFRGKEILTTIIDSKINVITATEFITDTVVVTPTAALANNNQLNSLLLPLLLQQQQQQQQQQQSGTPVTGLQAGALEQQQLLLQETVANDLQNQGYDSQEIDEDTTSESPSIRRKVARKNKRIQRPAEPTPPKETSIITLYVSGKRPGEFSTVLSTVIVGEESRRKREIQYIPVQPSKVLSIQSTASEYIDKYIMPAMDDVYIESSQTSDETESLESIIGDVSKHIGNTHFINKDTIFLKYSRSQKSAGQGTVPSGNFL